jgi:hypothetical protein
VVLLKIGVNDLLLFCKSRKFKPSVDFDECITMYAGGGFWLESSKQQHFEEFDVNPLSISYG